jgi:hypothetical protein
MNDLEGSDTSRTNLVFLGLIAVIGIGGLVVLFTEQGVTGNLAGLQRLGTSGVIERSPYEACRAARVGCQDGLVPLWTGNIDPNGLIECQCRSYPHQTSWVDTKLAYG